MNAEALKAYLDYLSYQLGNTRRARESLAVAVYAKAARRG